MNIGAGFIRCVFILLFKYYLTIYIIQSLVILDYNIRIHCGLITRIRRNIFKVFQSINCFSVSTNRICSFAESVCLDFQELESLCAYELEGQGLLPLFPFPLAADPRQGTEAKTAQDLHYSGSSAEISKHHPHLVSPRQNLMLKTKAHLVIRMIDMRIGQELLLQVQCFSQTRPPSFISSCR